MLRILNQRGRRWPGAEVHEVPLVGVHVARRPVGPLSPRHVRHRLKHVEVCRQAAKPQHLPEGARAGRSAAAAARGRQVVESWGWSPPGDLGRPRPPAVPSGDAEVHPGGCGCGAGGQDRAAPAGWVAPDAQQQIAGCRPSPVGAHGRRPRTRTRPSRKDEAELQGVLRGGPAPEPSPASAPPGFGGGACPPPIGFGFGEPSFLVQAKKCVLGFPQRGEGHLSWDMGGGCPCRTCRQGQVEGQ